MKPIRTLLVGLGGFGNWYVDAILDHGLSIGIKLVGTVDPAPESCKRYDEIVSLCGPSYPTIIEFFEVSAADLVVIVTPIHMHESMSIASLEQGAVVLCEKPAAGSIQAGLAMSHAAKHSKRALLIGYQWSFTDTVLQIKRRITAGEFGSCLSARVLGLWPRGASYYQRNNWAGKLKAPDGNWILDSPVNNALAHYIHNPLFMLGQDPVSVEAELYRACPIETFDTVAMRAVLSGGTELIFCASLAVPAYVGPLFHYKFETCEIVGREPGIFTIRHSNGRVETLSPIRDSVTESILLKLKHSASVALGESEPCCDIEDSLSQLRLIAGMHMSGSVRDLPEDLKQTTGDVTWSREFQEALIETYATGLLPGETGNYSWSTTSKLVSLEGLREFTGPADGGA